MLFIFDWDGTLLDSAGRIVHCLRRAAADSGLPRRDDIEYANVIGLGMREAIGLLYPDISVAGVEAFRDAYAGHFIREDRQPSAFFPQALSTLETLRSQGHQLAVATGKSRRGLDRVMAALDVASLFTVTRCADETASKPDPLMLVEILDSTGYEAAAALMVGDTEYDLAMARSAGVPSIGVSYGVHSVERLQQHGPIRIIDSLTALLS